MQEGVSEWQDTVLMLSFSYILNKHIYKQVMHRSMVRHARLTFDEVVCPGGVTNTVRAGAASVVAVVPLGQAPALAAIYSETTLICSGTLTDLIFIMCKMLTRKLVTTRWNLYCTYYHIQYL